LQQQQQRQPPPPQQQQPQQLDNDYALTISGLALVSNLEKNRNEDLSHDDDDWMISKKRENLD